MQHFCVEYKPLNATCNVQRFSQFLVDLFCISLDLHYLCKRYGE